MFQILLLRLRVQFPTETSLKKKLVAALKPTFYDFLLFQEGTLNSKPDRMVMKDSEQQFAKLRKAFDELVFKLTDSESNKQFKEKFLTLVGFSVVKKEIKSKVKYA